MGMKKLEPQNPIEAGLSEAKNRYLTGVEDGNEGYRGIAGRQLRNGNAEVMTVYRETKRTIRRLRDE